MLIKAFLIQRAKNNKKLKNRQWLEQQNNTLGLRFRAILNWLRSKKTNMSRKEEFSYLKEQKNSIFNWKIFITWSI